MSNDAILINKGIVTNNGIITNNGAIANYGTINGTGTIISAGIFSVIGIVNVPTSMTVGTPIALTGTIEPANATNQTIAWSVKAAGITGASIIGNNLSATKEGTVKVTATITNGANCNYKLYAGF